MQRRKQSKISRTTDYIICDSVAKLPIARSRKLVVSEVILARQTPSPLCPTNGSPEARLIKLLSLCCCQVTDQLSLLRLLRLVQASLSQLLQSQCQPQARQTRLLSANCEVRDNIITVSS